MTLTADDLNYMEHRIEICGIKYQEIYDEIKDHVIMAVQAARQAGDERAIEPVFEDMMASHFPGYYAFEKIAIQYEKAYRLKIKKAIWTNFKYYLNLQNCLLIALLLLTGYYLPETQVTSIILLACAFILTFIPVLYVDRKMKMIKPDNNKRSIIKDQVKFRAAFISTGLLCASSYKQVMHGFSDPRYIDPFFDMMLISFFIIYGLSSMRLCRQELKIAE